MTHDPWIPGNKYYWTESFIFKKLILSLLFVCLPFVSHNLSELIFRDTVSVEFILFSSLSCDHMTKTGFLTIKL